MYLSKADAHAISRAIFEIQQATTVIATAETSEEKLEGFHRRWVAEKALEELGINPDFPEDSESVSKKGFNKWWNLKMKYAA